LFSIIKLLINLLKISWGVTMSLLSILTRVTFLTSLLFLANCQMTDLAQNPLGALKKSVSASSLSTASANDAKTGNTIKSLSNILSLKDAVSKASPKVNVDAGFAEAVAAAVNSDPKVQIAKAEVLQQQARLGVTKSQLDFQFSGTIYAGIEDVTDKTNGIAAVLSASKLLYDGGQIANTVSGNEYAVQSAFESYKMSLDERAFAVSTAWVELERYQSLNALISDRLAVLDPLIKQLERVAEAGVGDATQVAAAQRVVSMIRITQTDVQERLAQAELNFVRLFGKLPKIAAFDSTAISKASFGAVTDNMIISAPALLANYAAYLSALHALEVAKAGNSMTVGLETKVQRPFGESGYDSDESIGFVVRKTLHDGNKLASEIQAAEAMVERQEANVKDVYRRGREAVETGMQSISSIDKSIGMARSNAQALNDEISLLRKQLVIGQSTLDSVLSAEARLYDAESKEINFKADKRKSQLSVLSAIGRLSSLVGIKAESDLK
jgi:outer membrane protein TolC